MTDLFGNPAAPPIGLTVQLVGARNSHRHDRCGDLATVEQGRAMHIASLRCVACGGFRGWIGHFEFNWLAAVAAKAGASEGPIVLRNWNTATKGESQMAKEYDTSNTGALFKADAKESARSPDYRGSLNVGGNEFWISGWLRVSKKGLKFISLAVKPKQQVAQTGGDAIPFDDAAPF